MSADINISITFENNSDYFLVVANYTEVLGKFSTEAESTKWLEQFDKQVNIEVTPWASVQIVKLHETISGKLVDNLLDLTHDNKAESQSVEEYFKDYFTK
ncbi:hypothetical protein ABE354_08825 [Brevibacillus laterosporus]|uniref:hypothetical protein n=1 Tax=Brevibacillus laterosporus TaxID=1465 RepID=UPI003D2495EB